MTLLMRQGGEKVLQAIVLPHLACYWGQHPGILALVHSSHNGQCFPLLLCVLFVAKMN